MRGFFCFRLLPEIISLFILYKGFNEAVEHNVKRDAYYREEQNLFTLTSERWVYESLHQDNQISYLVARRKYGVLQKSANN